MNRRKGDLKHEHPRSMRRPSAIAARDRRETSPPHAIVRQRLLRLASMESDRLRPSANLRPAPQRGPDPLIPAVEPDPDRQRRGNCGWTGRSRPRATA